MDLTDSQIFKLMHESWDISKSGLREALNTASSANLISMHGLAWQNMRPGGVLYGHNILHYGLIKKICMYSTVIM